MGLSLVCQADGLIVEIWYVEKKQPVPVDGPAPKYPEVARKAGIAGNESGTKKTGRAAADAPGIPLYQVGDHLDT